jgi:hypothetical protein
MSSADWDLGQRLIEQGTCSMDQVREILSLQDRLRKMGAASKPFARILLEKGYARRDQLLKAGVRESDLPPAVEEKPAAPAPAPAPVSRRPLAIGTALVLAVAGLILYARGAFTSGPPVGTTEPSKALTEDELDAVARTHLDKIAELAEKSTAFENAPEVVNRYEAFMKAQAGRKWEVEAHRRLKDYQGRAERFAKAEAEDLRSAEGPLKEQGRWVELLALYRKFPTKFLETTDTGHDLKQRIQEVTQRLIAQYAKDKAEVEQLLKDKKVADALARVKAMEVTTPPERQEDLFALRGLVERESRGVAEKARREVADAYYKVDVPFREAMSRRDGFRAAVILRDFLTAERSPEQKAFITVRGVDYDALLMAFEPWNPDKIVAICEAGVPEVDSPDLLGTGEGLLLSLRNAAFMAMFMRDYKVGYEAAVESKESLKLPDLGEGHFEKQNGKTVFVVKTGEVLEPETSPLLEDDFAALASRVGPEEPGTLARVGLFYFYSCPGDNGKQRAFENLVKARLKGARGITLYLGGLGAAAEAQLKRQLETKFGTAQDLFKNGRRPQARKLLGDLLDYPDHPFTKSVRPEIEKMLYEIAEGTENEKKLFVEYKGKVEILDDATLRVTYDFEGKEQQDAFESVPEEGPRKFKGRWHIDGGAMESSPEASVMRWKPSVKGDVTVEYDLTPVDEPQNLVLDLYTHRGQATHYAVVLGFDWVGKRDGDRDNSAEERFGMPRTCVIKYPVSVDKARWMEAETWDGWKTRLVGKPGAAWRPAKGQTARIRVERTGSAIRVLADRTLVWEGEDAAYTEGQLLFYSDSRCRVDNLSITFRP